MNPTTTKPSANALTARQEIDALYTPLDEAVAELRRRRQDTKLCARVEDFHRTLPPDLLPTEPFGTIVRPVHTPNHELEVFFTQVRNAGLRPLLLEYKQDVFVSHNREKYRLCRPAFSLRVNHYRNLHLIAFDRIEGQPMCNLKTTNGWDLQRFHHVLLERLYPNNGHSIADFSAWFFSSVKEEFYSLRYLGIFICHGILFENFVANDESELRFTREKVLPSFARAAEVFGVRPLIVPLLPRESEGSDYWRCLPGSLYPYAAELLSTKP